MKEISAHEDYIKSQAHATDEDHREFVDDNDQHRATLQDNSEHAEKLTWPVILSALFLGTSITGPVVFGFMLVSPILVQLTHELGGESIYFWIPSGWSASGAVGYSIAGRLSDIFGRRHLILAGQLLTVIGGIIACTANSMNQLIAGMVVLGAAVGTVSVVFAGESIYSSVLRCWDSTGIAEILPNKYRGMGLAWIEFNLAGWAVPSALLANAIISHATWRIIFYLAIGYGAFSLIGTFFVYFPPSHPRPDGKTKWQEFMEFDFIGTFLFSSGLATFLFGLNVGGNTYPWIHVGTIVPLILGFIVFMASFIYDFTIAKDPLFPWSLFQTFREFSGLLVLVFVGSMVFYTANALNTQTILYLHTPEAIKIGVYSLPSGVAQLVGGVVLPAMVHWIKHVHYQLTFAVFMQTLFVGLSALVTPTNLNWLMAVQFLSMMPFGWMTMVSYVTASLNVPQRDLGVSMGLIGTFRSLGGGIGSVIFLSIFGQTSAKQVPERISRTALAAGVPTESLPELVESVNMAILGVPGAATMSGISPAIFDACVRTARYAYAYSLRITWLASLAFGVIAIICAAWVRDPSKYFTNHLEIQLNKRIGGTYEGQEKKEESRLANVE